MAGAGLTPIREETHDTPNREPEMNAREIAEMLGVDEADVRMAAREMLIFGPRHAWHQVLRIRRHLAK